MAAWNACVWGGRERQKTSWGREREVRAPPDWEPQARFRSGTSASEARARQDGGVMEHLTEAGGQGRVSRSVPEVQLVGPATPLDGWADFGRCAHKEDIICKGLWLSMPSFFVLL